MSAIDPSIEIPSKEPGAAYTIVLQEHPSEEGQTLANDSRPTRHPRYPSPTFTDRCICCNQSADGHRHPYSPWMGKGYGRHPIDLPLCQECTGHAFSHPDPPGVALLPIVPGVIAIWLGVWKQQPTRELVGIIVSLVALVLFGLWRQTRRRKRHSRHHEGIDIDARPGRLRIATRNPELVRSVVALNRPLIRRIR